MKLALDLYKKQAKNPEVAEWLAMHAAELLPVDSDGEPDRGFRTCDFGRLSDLAYQAESKSNVAEYYDALEFWSGAVVAIEQKRDRVRKRKGSGK